MWWCGSITFGVCARADRMALWKTLNNYVLFTMACKILCNTSTRVYKIQVKFSLGSDPLEGWKKKVYAIFFPMLHDFRNSMAFWKVPRLRPFVVLIRAACRCSVWSIGWVILNGGERELLRETSFPMRLCTTKNPIRPGPGSNPGLRAERSATNRLSHGTATENLI